jgi:hypothetical protein
VDHTRGTASAGDSERGAAARRSLRKHVCEYRSAKLLVRNESDSGWTHVRHNLPAPLSWEEGLSVSIHVWTRKVATYA